MSSENKNRMATTKKPMNWGSILLGNSVEQLKIVSSRSKEKWNWECLDRPSYSRNYRDSSGRKKIKEKCKLQLREAEHMFRWSYEILKHVHKYLPEITTTDVRPVIKT
jgi:hypothetical protein